MSVDSTQPTLWVDVEDLVHYLANHRRPSGIQRVTFEICQALTELDGGSGSVRFLRRGTGPCDMLSVDWNSLYKSYTHIANASDRPAINSGIISSRRTVPGSQKVQAATDGKRREKALGLLASTLKMQAVAIVTLAWLPVRVVTFAGRIAARHLTSGLSGRWMARAGVGGRRHVGSMENLFVGRSLREAARPGDVFIVLGSPWMYQDYVQTVRMVRDDLRMRFALLIYDMIPARRPEWCNQGVITTFANWHRSVLPLADQIFSISRATADDVTGWAHETGVALLDIVQPIPMGTGLTEQHSSEDSERDHLPSAGSYVLFVSTIEARKNHELLFRVWRRLLTDLPSSQVPTLIFAGRVGWLVVDLLQQLENSNWLNGKIRLLRDPTDSDLSALYRGCRFTVFPSLFEGWGLPVSESLAMGKPAIISDRTSLPEAGGNLARYFDPENVDDAYLAIRAVIEDPVDLQKWCDRVAADFQKIPWTAAATVIRQTLNTAKPKILVEEMAFLQQRQAVGTVASTRGQTPGDDTNLLCAKRPDLDRRA